MKNLIISILLIMIQSLIFAQNQGNVWYFGDQAGLDFNTKLISNKLMSP